MFFLRIADHFRTIFVPFSIVFWLVGSSRLLGRLLCNFFPFFPFFFPTDVVLPSWQATAVARSAEVHGAAVSLSPAFVARTKAYTVPAGIYPGRSVVSAVSVDSTAVDTDSTIVSVDCEAKIGEVLDPAPWFLASCFRPRALG